MSPLPPFQELAADSDPPLDLLALALAAEFRPVDPGRALGRLDALAEELVPTVRATDASPHAQARGCAELLGATHGFAGSREQYDDPDNSMLDLVLERRRGLPILLSVVYVEVARRAGIPLAGVGLPGHFVAGHFGIDPPVLIDPFRGGADVDPLPATPALVPWGARDIAWRMLNNLIASYERRGDLGPAIRAAQMRLTLPAARPRRDAMNAELRALQARLN